ncbi:MAG: hypothetical protein AAGE52_34640 [Myxococcota bacterium]
MQQQTFRAAGFEAALTQVREVLGPDAMILSSRQLKGGVEIEATRLVADSQSATLLERRFTRMGVPKAAAETLARGVQRRHGGTPGALAQARPALEEVLEGEMIFAGGIAHAPRVVAFVGPTGVGKTTTLAKIAAHAALVQRRSVGLVCLDQYRVAGAEQLQRYADLIGVPMESAHDERSLRASLRRLGSADLVLVDTAGRSPRDEAAIGVTGAQLQNAGEPVETHLCFPANVSDIELEAIIERYGEAHGPRRLIATKVDEAVYHGSIVAAQIHGGIPYSYFTTGQRVPEDIEVASAGRLASLLSGEGVFA